NLPDRRRCHCRGSPPVGARMKLHYEDEFVRLYQGDSIASAKDTLEWLEADVLITDPPYGMDYQSNWSKSDAIPGDLSVRVRDEALRLWGEAKPALVFGRWTEPRPDHTIGMKIRQLVVWHKGD